MSIRDGHLRKVSFDTKEELGDKIDILAAMIGKLATRDSGKTGNLNHKSIRVEADIRTGTTIREIIRIGSDPITDQIAETEDNTDKTEAGLGMNKILGEVILEEMLEIVVDKIVGENIEIAIEMTVLTEAGMGLERSFSRNYGNNRTRSTSDSRSRLGSRASTNRDRIHCYK